MSLFRRRKKSAADLAVRAMPRAVAIASDKWLEFQVLKFKDEVSLADRIYAFSVPLREGLRSWEAFKVAPDEIFLLIAAKGVEASGTHSKEEIEASLGVPLPN